MTEVLTVVKEIRRQLEHLESQLVAHVTHEGDPDPHSGNLGYTFGPVQCEVQSSIAKTSPRQVDLTISVGLWRDIRPRVSEKGAT